MAGELTQRRSTGGAVTRRRSSGARAAARACHRLEHMVVMFAFQKRRPAAIEAVQAPATAAAARPLPSVPCPAAAGAARGKSSSFFYTDDSAVIKLSPVRCWCLLSVLVLQCCDTR